MNNKYIKKGFTIVELMIIVAVIAVIIAMVGNNLIRSKTNAVEANAQATLKTISTAVESYAGAFQGMYPEGSDLSVLYDSDPKYINKDYVNDCTIGSPCQGYSYGCTLSISGYTCTATPNENYSGARTYQVITGSKITIVE